LSDPYVTSNFERVKDDNYETIDPRCLLGLIQGWPEIEGILGDPCHSNGQSELVKQARMLGLDAFCVDRNTLKYDAERYTHWIVTNPPYSPARTLNAIIERGMTAVQNKSIAGAAYLLRTSIDHGKLRSPYFNTPLFAGVVKLQFRPWWSEKRDSSPIHNFSWFIWSARRPQAEPVLRYWSEH
jgi:hypothetical protein